MYSSTLSLTSELDGGGWLTPPLGRFTPETETQHPLYRKLSGPQGRSGWARETSPPPGCPARSESLRRLSHRGPPTTQIPIYFLLSFYRFSV